MKYFFNSGLIILAVSWPFLVCSCLWRSDYQPPHIFNNSLLQIQCDSPVSQSSQSSPIKLLLCLASQGHKMTCLMLIRQGCLSVTRPHLPTSHLSVYRWGDHVLFPNAFFSGEKRRSSLNESSWFCLDGCCQLRLVVEHGESKRCSHW